MITQITISNGEYPVTPFSLSDAKMNDAYYRLQAIANKYQARNAKARKIYALLGEFAKAVRLSLGDDWFKKGESFVVDVDFSRLQEAVAIDDGVQAAQAQAVKKCGVGGCETRIPVKTQMCTRCAHDEA